MHPTESPLGVLLLETLVKTENGIHFWLARFLSRFVTGHAYATDHANLRSAKNNV